MKLLFILHADFELPGFIESWASEKGFELCYSRPFAGEELPKSDASIDMIISMGGPQSVVTDLHTLSYLSDEVQLLRNALKAEIPVFGFCLGAQLLGEALGSRAEPSPYKEIGVYPITLTEEGMCDPLLQGLPRTFPVTHWHSEMPGLTNECQVLATSEGCPRQIIRYRPYAYGFQCHPEMTQQIIHGLIKMCPKDFIPGKYIQTPEEILSHNIYDLNYGNMMKILDNFFRASQGSDAQPLEKAVKTNSSNLI